MEKTINCDCGNKAVFEEIYGENSGAFYCEECADSEAYGRHQIPDEIVEEYMEEGKEQTLERIGE